MFCQGTKQYEVTSALFGAALLSVTAMPSEARADTAMTAGVVLDRMESPELWAYTSGILEGIMYQTAIQAGDDSARVKCMYDWYYGDSRKKVGQVLTAFERFRDHYPAAIIHALIKRECGDE